MDVGSVSQHDFTVLSNEPAAKGIWRMWLASDVAGLLSPGQFMNFTVPGDGAHILKVPLSFARADADDQSVEILYAVVGEGTERLSRMREGDSSTLLGPCGKGWRLPTARGRVLLVAGGIGLPPVMAAGRMLAAAGIGFDVVVGARTKSMMVFPDVDRILGYGKGMRDATGGYDPDRMVVKTTDDGSLGGSASCRRYATDGMAELLGERTYAQVYTCGPTVMMSGVARLAAEHGIPCQASLERMMGCGFGACACCNVALAAGGYALCCQDGPVFDASEVAW